MELIPVFAFIVLVATIATFIFSLAAYILYKIREKRGRFTETAPHQAFKAELVAPNYYYLPSDVQQVNEMSNEANEAIDSRDGISKQVENDIVNKNNGNELVWK